MSATGEVGNDEGQHRHNGAQLATNMGVKVTDAVVERVHEAKHVLKDRQSRSVQHVRIHGMSDDDAHSEAAATLLAEKLCESSVEPPSASGLVVEYTSGRIENDPNGVPHRHTVTIKAKGEARAAQHRKKRVSEQANVGVVPEKHARVVDVRGKQRPTRMRSGRRTSVEDELLLGLNRRQAKPSTGQEHRTHQRSVAELENDAPTHRQCGELSKQPVPRLD